MKKNNENILFDKIIVGLDLAYEKMLAFKKQKNSEIIIWRDDKIVRLKP